MLGSVSFIEHFLNLLNIHIYAVSNIECVQLTFAHIPDPTVYPHWQVPFSYKVMYLIPNICLFLVS